MVQYFENKNKREDDDSDLESGHLDFKPFQVDKFAPFKFSIPVENILRIIVKTGELDELI